jgi:16S rRNA processing protein RimM
VITIGKVSRPFGAKGEIQVLPMTDFPERFFGLKRVNLSDGAERQLEIDVEGVRPARNGVIFKLKGIETRRDAKGLQGLFLTVYPHEALPLPEGRYYIHDIIGLHVVTDDGMSLGRIRDVLVLASNDVYVVQGEGGEVLIPAIRDVVKTIDIRGGTMIIHVLEGMLD